VRHGIPGQEKARFSEPRGIHRAMCFWGGSERQPTTDGPLQPRRQTNQEVVRIAGACLRLSATFGTRHIVRVVKTAVWASRQSLLDEFELKSLNDAEMEFEMQGPPCLASRRVYILPPSHSSPVTGLDSARSSPVSPYAVLCMYICTVVTIGT
jgi:hypothetical protein